MPTPQQIKLIKTGMRKLDLSEPQYRLLLRNVAGVESCRDLDQPGVEDVMAVMEDMGFTGDDPNYWRKRVRARGCEAGPRMVRKIEQLAAGGIYPLPALVRRMSGGRTDNHHDLHPAEAWNLIEALKAIDARAEPKQAAGRRSPAAGKEAPATESPAARTEAGTVFEEVPF